MSDILSRINAHLSKPSNSLDSNIIQLIVDALPEIAFGDDFLQRLSLMLQDKVDQSLIPTIASELSSHLQQSAKSVLNSIKTETPSKL